MVSHSQAGGCFTFIDEVLLGCSHAHGLYWVRDCFLTVMAVE